MGGAEGPLAFNAYQRLDEAGELNLRLWMMLPGERLNQAIEMGLRTGFGDDYLRVGHVKFFSDGGQGARTAWMLEDYEDTPSRGMPLTSMNDDRRCIPACAERLVWHWLFMPLVTGQTVNW